MAGQMKIKPLPGFVLIEPITEESRGGYFISAVSTSKANLGKVVAIGKRTKDSPKIEVGQKVIFDSLAKHELIYPAAADGGGFILLADESIMAIVEER